MLLTSNHSLMIGIETLNQFQSNGMPTSTKSQNSVISPSFKSL